jgi:hypothetical protein
MAVDLKKRKFELTKAKVEKIKMSVDMTKMAVKMNELIPICYQDGRIFFALPEIYYTSNLQRVTSMPRWFARRQALH